MGSNKAPLTKRIDFVFAYAETVNNITLSGAQTVDGETTPLYLHDPQVNLLTAQTDPTENGLWEARPLAWTRPTYWNTSGQLMIGQRFTAQVGTHEQDTFYLYTNSSPGASRPILGVTPLNFKKDYLNDAYIAESLADARSASLTIPSSFGGDLVYGPPERIMRDHVLDHQRDSVAYVFEDDFDSPKLETGYHYIPSFSATVVSGTWTLTEAADIPILTRTAANTTEVILFDLDGVVKGGSLNDEYITGVDIKYTANTGLATDVLLEVVSVDLNLDNVAATAAALACTYDAAHDTAAERASNTGAPEIHRQQLTLVSPVPTMQTSRLGLHARFTVTGLNGAVIIVHGLMVRTAPKLFNRKWYPQTVQTIGNPTAYESVGAGGLAILETDVVNEVQQIHVDWGDWENINPAAGFIGEIAVEFNPAAALPNVNTTFCVGFCNAYAAVLQNITRHIFVRITGADLSLIVDNDDGTTDQSVDSTVDAVVGTRYRFRFDLTAIGDVTVFYRIDGATSWTILRAGIDMGDLVAGDLMQPLLALQTNSAVIEQMEVDYVKCWVERG